MANEKILNTRIQLKYDSYANWTSNNPTLKPGEVAIAYLASSHTSATPNNDTHPVMFKVGPGAFNALPWASALAADVYGWAKQSESDFVNSFLNLKMTDGTTMQSKLDGVFATDTALSTAISDLRTELTTGDGGLIKLKETVENIAKDYLTSEDIKEMVVGSALEEAVKAEADRAKEAEKGLSDRIDAIDFVDNTELANALSPYLKSNDAAATYETIANATLIRNRVTALEDHKDDYKSYADTAEADAIAAAKTETQNQVKALSDSIKDHATVDSFADVMTEMNKYQLAGDYATKTEAQGYANAKDSAIAEAKKAGTDAAAALNEYKTENNAAVALKADKTALDEEINRAKAAEAKALTDAKAYTDTVKNALLGEGIKETFDTLVEIQNWIEGDGVNATELSEAIAAEAKTRGEAITEVKGLISSEADRADKEEKRLAGLIAGNTTAIGNEVTNRTNEITRVEGLITSEASRAKTEEERLAGLIKTNADSIAELGMVGGKVKNAEHADTASGLDATGIAQVQGIKVDNAVDADKLGGVVASEYVTKTAAPGYADILTKTVAASTYEPIGAETRAKSYADGLASNYATAAQGAKADSALQAANITTGSNNGTISVKGTDVAVKGLGSAAYTDSTAYATAAQGAKADSALQEITTTANNGLKVTNKNNIEIDTDVVFVFNCGTASTLVD